MTMIRATISGGVQGVGYRAWCRSEAKHRGLAGWVRNRRDGSVEALFDGEAEVIDEMIAALWTGPAGSNVSNVETAEAEGETGGSGRDPFEIRGTV